MNIEEILDSELQGSINFFYDYTNQNSGSSGYGLTVDTTKKPDRASIASVGFALTAWVIAADRGLIEYQEALKITRGTLHTLNHHADHHRGFFAHFLHMDDGKRFRECEYSTIDTALCLNGVITAAAYFNDSEIKEMGERLLERVDWRYFIFFTDVGKALFRMAYNPDRTGDYTNGRPGFISQWDMAAEQKMMYLQAAPYLEPDLAQKLYQGFSRDIRYFEDQPIIVNPGGNLFAYQFSEAWLDCENYIDLDGIDWFNNTRLAALANHRFCVENAKTYRTYHANSWGLSCGDSPWAYSVSGSSPCLMTPCHNGTISIYGAIASLPFVPDHAISMIYHLHENHPETWGKYGFFDSYNLDHNPPWFSKAIYGINKGCSMIMLENYRSRLIWEIYTNSPIIQKSLAILNFSKKGKHEHVQDKGQPILA